MPVCAQIMRAFCPFEGVLAISRSMATSSTWANTARFFSSANAISFFCHRAIGVGAVVQMEFTNAPIRSRARALCKFGLHHVKDGLVPKPVVVVGTVAVQADEGHHGHARLAGLRAVGQQLGAIVGPRVGDDGAHTAQLHALQHVSHRMGPSLAVPGFLVVVQMRVKQRARIVGGAGRR